LFSSEQFSYRGGFFNNEYETLIHFGNNFTVLSNDFHPHKTTFSRESQNVHRNCKAQGKRRRYFRRKKDQRGTALGELSSKFRILANISEKLPINKKPILVGGSAVEFYTRGTCKSIDIDLLGDRDSLVKLLEDMGFSKGKLIRIISIEDLIVELDKEYRPVREAQDPLRPLTLLKRYW
jgi:hypothetical protein